MIEQSVASDAAHVKCFGHEGKGCPRCDGSGYRPRKHCAGCGEPSGRPSQGGKALMGMPNVRGWDQPMWCMDCHPLFVGQGLAAFDGIGG